MKSGRCFTGLSLMLVVCLGVSRAEPVSVQNPEAAPLVETWQMQEHWRIGDSEDDPLLGVIENALADHDGNVLLLDHQLAHVLVISPEGQVVQTLGRDGDGPGEVRRPRDLVLFSDGAVGMVQLYPAKVVRLTLENIPLDSIVHTDGVGFYERAREAGGVLVMAGNAIDMENRRPDGNTAIHRIRRLSLTGETQYTYFEKSIFTNFSPPTFDEAASFFPSSTWDLNAAGNLVIAPERDRYYLEFIGPDGELQRTMERDFQPYRRTDDDREAFIKDVSYTVGDQEVEVDVKLLPTEPAIRNININHDGSIWIRSCYADRDLPAGVARRYDVLNADGGLEKEVHIACDADVERDGLMPLGDGRFLWIRSAVSAAQSMYADDSDTEAAEEDDMMVEVICLQRKN